MEGITIDCPVCQGKGTATSLTKTDKIPYFGEIMESTIICSSCGYKHNDVICLDQDEPSEYTLDLNKENLNVRIIKAQSATITIPELGLKVEPGPKSMGYISNMEGVLERFKSAVNSAKTLFNDKESLKNADAILDSIDEIIKGELSVEIILQDPFGQSKILDKKAKYRELTEDDLKTLKTGFTTFESEDIN